MPTIELRPHVGHNTARNCEEDLGQDRIYVDGQAVGYVGREPNAHILMAVPYVSPVVRDAITAAVREKYGGTQAGINCPPELPDTLDDDDDFDEED